MPSRKPKKSEDPNPTRRKGNAGTRHPKFIASQWKKGQSGNPGGRVSNQKTLEKAIRELMQADVEDGKQRIDLVAAAFVKLAVKGNPAVIKAIFDRLWPQGQELTIRDGASNPFDAIDLSDLSRDELGVALKLIEKIEQANADAGEKDGEADAAGVRH